MHRKTFIKLSLLLPQHLYSLLFRIWLRQDKLKNWAGNLTYSTSNVFYPEVDFRSSVPSKNATNYAVWVPGIVLIPLPTVNTI